AADLAAGQVAVIVGPNVSMRAARAATSTIPIVFVSGADPIASGLVTNLNRPGGNVTGVTFGSGPLQPKRLALLHELVPPPATVAWLGDPRAPRFEMEEREGAAAARELGGQNLALNAQSRRRNDAAFATIVQSRAGALLIGNSILFNNRRACSLVANRNRRAPAVRCRLPTGSCACHLQRGAIAPRCGHPLAPSLHTSTWSGTARTLGAEESSKCPRTWNVGSQPRSPMRPSLLPRSPSCWRKWTPLLSPPTRAPRWSASGQWTRHSVLIPVRRARQWKMRSLQPTVCAPCSLVCRSV